MTSSDSVLTDRDEGWAAVSISVQFEVGAGAGVDRLDRLATGETRVQQGGRAVIWSDGCPLPSGAGVDEQIAWSIDEIGLLLGGEAEVVGAYRTLRVSVDVPGQRSLLWRSEWLRVLADADVDVAIDCLAE